MDNKSAYERAAQHVPDDSGDARVRNYMRPKDASTLIVIDRAARPARVLMGRRNSKHAFKPGAFVFPGGRVDRQDSYVPVCSPYRRNVDLLLGLEPRAKVTDRRRKAFGVAAIRETMEEAGLMIGARAPEIGDCGSEEWRCFDKAGLTPDLSSLALIARAITPPGRPRRFDTRFFAAFRDQTVDAGSYGHAVTDELGELDWYSFDDTAGLNLPSITEYVLKVLAERLAFDPTLEQPTAIPFFEAPRGKSRTTLIEA